MFCFEAILKDRRVFIYRAEFLCKSAARGRIGGKMEGFVYGKYEKGGGCCGWGVWGV